MHFGSCLPSLVAVLTVSAYANPHHYPIEDENTDNGQSSGLSAQRLSECRRDNDHKFNSIHLLASETISKVAEDALAKDGTSRSSDLD